MQVPFGQLITFARKIEFSEAIRRRVWQPDDIPFADTHGFHIYCDLDLQLILAAAENSDTAFINLQILQAYASAAEAVGHAARLKILEIQGRRLHLFRESNAPARDAQEIIDA